VTIPPVSAIADVLALYGRDGWLTPPLAPVVAPSEPRIGRACTVGLCAESPGSGLAPLHEIVSRPLRDEVLVIAGARPIGGAIWGEIMSRAARRQGAVAILLDGIARDAGAMADEGLPVFAAELAVVGPAGRASIRTVGEPVEIGAVSVAPGDTIVVDASGAVRIASADAGAILEAARAYAEAEQEVMDALAAGEPLVEAYRFKKAAVSALTAAENRFRQEQTTER
jgi:4-hydroxy-4-methyl-2-oxoglutarate aldolase